MFILFIGLLGAAYHSHPEELFLVPQLVIEINNSFAPAVDSISSFFFFLLYHSFACLQTAQSKCGSGFGCKVLGAASLRATTLH